MAFDVDFCERCGAAAEEIVDLCAPERCHDAENVAAIRPWIARRQVSKIVDAVMARYGY